MVWQPNYRRDLRRRLTAAANLARTFPTSRSHIEHAITSALCAFSESQFPADFRKQFAEVVAVGLSVKTMTDEELAETVRKIIELEQDVLG